MKVDIVPNYITHYYNAGSDILKNVCSQPDEVAEKFLSSLKENGKRAWLFKINVVEY